DDAGDLDAVVGLARRALVELLKPGLHRRVLPLRLGRKHDCAPSAKVDELVDHGAIVLQKIDTAPVEQLDVRLVETAGRQKPLVPRGEYVRVWGVLKGNDLSQSSLHRLDPSRA